MTANLIGRDGRPLRLAGLAAPYCIPAKDGEVFARRPFTEKSLARNCDLVWEHERETVIVGGHRIELIDTDDALFFEAYLPDLPSSRYLALVATTGTLRCSIGFNPYHVAKDGTIERAGLVHLGATFRPAHPETICWRSDSVTESLTEEQRAARARFAVAAMATRQRAYAPWPSPTAKVFKLPGPAERARRREQQAADRRAAKDAEFAQVDELINEMNRLNGSSKGRQSVTVALQAARARGCARQRDVRPGVWRSPGRTSPFDGAA